MSVCLENDALNNRTVKISSYDIVLKNNIINWKIKGKLFSCYLDGWLKTIKLFSNFKSNSTR